MVYICNNCGHTHKSLNDLGCQLHEIPNIADYLEIGGITPAGGCVKCKSLVYPVTKPTKTTPPKNIETKIDLNKLSMELVNINVPLRMSERSVAELSFQKLTLLMLQENSDERTFDYLEGIIGMIDHIQDYLLKYRHFKENSIFPIKGD